MDEGDVALTQLPQADGQAKLRPVLILRRMPGFGDLLVCGISTQLQHEVVGFDETLGPSDGDFSASGLKSKSVIRLGYLAALPSKRLLGKIGEISEPRVTRLRCRLGEYLQATVKD